MKLFNDISFFGYLGGLRMLFFIEMWECMSYYGMCVLFVFFMIVSL